MTVDIGSEDGAMNAETAAVDRRYPVIDRDAVEAAWREHFAAIGLPMKPVRWVVDLERGFSFIVEQICSAYNSNRNSAIFFSLITCHPIYLDLSSVRCGWIIYNKALHNALSISKDTVKTGISTFNKKEGRFTIKSEEVILYPKYNHFHYVSQAREKSLKIHKSQKLKKTLEIYRPMVSAFDAGLAYYWVTEQEIICVPRPELMLDGDTLHCETGPAIHWPGGAAYYFWHGVRVPDFVVERPAEITVAMIDAETNAEIRRVMIERYRHGDEISGAAAYLQDAGAERLDYDERFGTLWRRAVPNDEPIVMVEVVNRTPEPDGHFKHYFLRVHPECRPLLDDGTLGKPQKLTARAAVASTFGKRAKEYAPEVET